MLRRSRAQLVLSFLLIGCAPRTPEPVPPTTDEAARETLVAELIPPCPVERLRPLVGRPLSPALEAEARRLTGLFLTRVRRPGEPYTQDRRTERLNIDVDEAGRVVRFVCE